MIKVLLASITPTADGEWRAELVCGDPESTLRKTANLAEFFGNSIGPCRELDTPLKVGGQAVTGKLRSVLEWVALMHEELEKRNDSAVPDNTDIAAAG